MTHLLRRRWWGSFLGVCVLGSVAYFIWPAPQIESQLARAAPREDLTQISPSAESISLLHAEPVSDLFILLHGVTNNPEQFRAFGELLYARGADVLIPRMPFHGLLDRLTPAQKNFTAVLALRETLRVLKAAETCGQRITVVGLSVNGLPAAWVAMNRPEVDRVMLLAPFFSVHGMPDWLITPTAQLFQRWPNFFIWWDADLRENLPSPPGVYPRFSTRTMASFLQFGVEIFNQARRQAPRVREVIVVTTAADRAISNARVAELAELWQNAGFHNLQTYEFPAEEAVPHDFIDPHQPDQQTERVYPVLLDLLQKP